MIVTGSRVTGAVGPDEQDVGTVLEIDDDYRAKVEWDSGVWTRTPVSELRPAD